VAVAAAVQINLLVELLQGHLVALAVEAHGLAQAYPLAVLVFLGKALLVVLVVKQAHSLVVEAAVAVLEV
jgi:hypothetical protein